MSQQTFTFHGPVTIHMFDGAAPTNERLDEKEAGRRKEPDLFEKKQAFDPDYSRRGGYDADFLGVTVPAPDVRSERAAEMLTTFGKGILVLRYHHYSLAMNKVRRLVMWTAANVDYSDAMRGDETRETYGADTWTADPRVPARLQIQNEDFYLPALQIDRGHVVRRDDTAWGSTAEERAFANADTYHWTNCTPQHERFNRSRVYRGAWGALEDTIKGEAQRSGSKLSIFAGPVLAADDPEALGIQYPLLFWKVIAAVEEDKLRAYAFVLDQSRVVEGYGLGLQERMSFGDLSEQQCPLSRVEALTGVSFSRVLHDADVMAGEEPREIKSATDLCRPR